MVVVAKKQPPLAPELAKKVTVAKMSTAQTIMRALRPFRAIGGDVVGQTKRVEVCVPSVSLEVARAMLDEKLRRRVAGRRLLTGYQLFFQEEMVRARQAHDDEGADGKAELPTFSEVGAAWKELADDEKDDYRTRAADGATGSGDGATPMEEEEEEEGASDAASGDAASSSSSPLPPPPPPPPPPKRCRR